MKYEIGDEITTKVVAIGRDAIFIDLSEKSEGIIDKSELTDESGTVTCKMGDTIKVYYAGLDGDTLKFTTKISAKALAQNTVAQGAIIENAYRGALPIEGTVTNEIKGGYEVMIGGERAFCPYSQMGGRDKKESHYYVGKTLSFKITQYETSERGKKNIVLSNRAIVEEIERQKISKALSLIKVGVTITGTVKSLHNFGAIISITTPVEAAGLEALLPISQISYERVNEITDVLKEGEVVSARVIDCKIPTTANSRYKISVSKKDLETDPWSDIGRFKVGDKVTGTIESAAPYGLFVNIAKGITGFTHISKLSDIEKNTNLSKVYKAGTPFSVIIDKIDSDNKRIELTPSTSRESDEEAARYMASHNDDSMTYNPFAALLEKKSDNKRKKSR